MKRTAYVFIFVIIALSSYVHAQPDTLWTQTYGGNGAEWGYSVQQTSDGGYIIVGYTSSYGAGGRDVYLVKTDGSGNEVWYQTFGGSSSEKGYSVQQTSDGGYIITGYTNSYGAGDIDVYLIKTDASGNEQWSQTFGGLYWDFGYSVQQTSDGGYVIAGRTVSYGSGSSDVYLIKTDGSGNEVWSRTFGGSSGEYGYSVQQTSDGGYIIAGLTWSFGAGSADVYLIKTDGSGDEVWRRTFGGSSRDEGRSVQQTSDGGYIIAGYTWSYGAGNKDVYLIKTDGEGNEVWSKTFGGSGNEEGHCVQQTSDGGYVITGFKQVPGTHPDVYIIKINEVGNEEWTQTFGGSVTDYGYSVQQTSDGGYVIGGVAYSYGVGICDVWLIRLESWSMPSLTLNLIPFVTPIQIPVGGGSFEFYLFATNDETSSQEVDLWTWVIYPDGTISEPLMGQMNLLLQSGTTGWYRVQNVPGTADPGMYQYVAMAGQAPNGVWASDTLVFEKLATGDGSWIGDWDNWGDPIWDKGNDELEYIPGEFALHGAYPNPFNPKTAINYQLSAISNVNLAVYDISGRMVAQLVDVVREAGIHEATFDGSNLPSGIYIYRLNASDFTASGKMVLMK